MMDFYKLELGYSGRFEWRAILRSEENNKYKIVNKLNNGDVLQIDDPIQMDLININLIEDRKDFSPFDLDFIYWANDITLDAFSPNKSACVIISSKLKELIQKYSFHTHNYHEIQLNHTEEDSFKDYYLLHILGSRMDFINYQKSSYLLKERPSRKVVEKFPNDYFFEDKQSFITKRSQLLTEKKVILDFDKVVYNVDYDILWGIPNELFICEGIKTEIENSDLQGFEVNRIKSPEYILKSEFEGNK